MISLSLRSLPWLAAALLICAPAEALAQLMPRVQLDPGPVQAAPLPLGTTAPVHRQLVVKMSDDVLGRATPAGGIESLTGASLDMVEVLAAAHGVTFAPVLRTPQAKLDALQDRAAARSGRAQPDLAGLLLVEAPLLGVDELVALGNALRACEGVEFAVLQTLGAPPPADIAPTTPDLSVNQVYMGGGAGLGVDVAAGLGLDGAGIRLSDCEYGWNPAHEDLEDIDLNLEAGQTVHPEVVNNNFDDHGTSVVGATSAPANGYGVSGIARGATLATYPEWTLEEGLRRVAAVTNALADSAVGDVVLLEMQTFGVGGGLAPAEVDPAVFMATQVGTDAGVIVVAAAGNGNQDLDSAPYFDYRAMGDSGAIMVGGGSADTNHDKLPFSTFGARVNVQAWGEMVFTLGGNFLVYGGDPNQAYTNSFNGTSSASALVAGVCCLIQQKAVADHGVPLSPRDMRYLLSVSGTPQGAGGNIGPAVDVPAALAKLPDMYLPRWEDLGGGAPGVNGVPQLVGSGDLTPGSDINLSLTGGAPFALSFVWISAASAPVPFLNGTLYANPFFAQLPIFLDGAGSVIGTAPFPEGLPPGTPIWWQMGIADATALPDGGSLSNAVVSTTP